MGTRDVLVFVLLSILSASALSDLVILKCDRRIDLRTHIVRVSTSLKVENIGPAGVSEFLLTVPNFQAQNLAYLMASSYEGHGKSKGSVVNLSANLVQRDGMPPDITVYSVSLPKELGKGESLTFDILSVFTHSLKPFPEEITQADIQLVVYQDGAYYLSPYEVKVQSLSVQAPSPRVEFYTKLPNVKLVDSEIKYGPYDNLPPFSFTPIIVHFENNRPFAVVKKLVREIEISHWGNVQVTEHYCLVHGGARNKGGFSRKYRIEYQARPDIRGAASFRHLTARLPPRAHSIYYRDQIGNISTSNLWADSRKTELRIEPRYPLFGGWKTDFTIGYGLPLQDFLFESEGKLVLNFSFGCPIDEVVIDNLVVKAGTSTSKLQVVLPEGSKDMFAHIPFDTNQRGEVKFSHLDFFGRPVVVLEKENVVPEHNQHFQVYYKFNCLSMLQEPLMLISGFFLFFIACIVFKHMDISISKSSSAYIAKLQWDEVIMK
ncbi:Dolichyl-diphosphooligosaccharide--protein glycosyltransferase subunit 1A [Nymphaea thermarum]|nr:Dolichyl-diphosphooligosaccharide--protein glycosyltransferase subunit 1A [Nymphaea thermarum]